MERPLSGSPSSSTIEGGPTGTQAWWRDGDTVLSIVAVTLGVYWAIGEANYRTLQPGVFALFVLGLAVAVYVLRADSPAPWCALGYAVAVGLANRTARHAFNGSDVLGVTREAIIVVARGGNPYSHTYLLSNPRGSPFPYLPGEIAFYSIPHALVGQIVGADKWAGVGVVLALACLAFAVGPAPAALCTALYATFEPAVLRSLDGSNDTGLAFLVVVAVCLLALAERTRTATPFYLSAVFFAWALAFKEFSWLIYPLVLAHIRAINGQWLRYLAVTLVLVLAAVLPFFVSAPGGFVHNVVRGVTFHREAAGLDLWAAARTLGWELPLSRYSSAIVLVAVLIASVILIRRPATNLGIALFQGIAVLFVALSLANYATSSYYTFACAVAAAALGLYVGGKRARGVPSEDVRSSRWPGGQEEGAAKEAKPRAAV